MKIKIDSNTFSATLHDNEATHALKLLLPITLKMKELNGNEKYAELATNLPTKSTTIGTIQSGDIMLWETNTLVIFYKTFKTPYGYTRIGRIDNPHGLTTALGLDDVTILFELE